VVAKRATLWYTVITTNSKLRCDPGVGQLTPGSIGKTTTREKKMNSTVTSAILAQIIEWENQGIDEKQIYFWVAEILADIYED
jgi:hypothetical protein